MKAIWNGQIIAESDDTVLLEGNHYFPADSLKEAFFKSSELHTTCPYKGVASYYSFEKIAGRVAFWRGVQVVES